MTFIPTHSKLHTSTLLSLLHHAKTRNSQPLARLIHAQIITNGHHQNPLISTNLITLYSQCQNPTSSKLVFDSLTPKSIYLYNILISGYVKNHAFIDALRVFNQMRANSVDGVVGVDEFTVSSVCKGCGEVGLLGFGMGVHGLSVKCGFIRDIVVGNSVMGMYLKCGEFGECLRLFGEMGVRNSGSWNVLVGGVAAGLGGGEVWGVLRGMVGDGVKLSGFTVSSVLPLCGKGYGREVHCYVLRNGLDSVLGSDVHLGCCLVDMYSRNGEVGLGRRVFERMRWRNIFAWTAMVNGYVKDSNPDEALVLFRSMQIRDGVEPNRVSLVSVLPACSLLAELMLGKQVHGFAIRKEFDWDVSLCNALIDMYVKCGSLGYARKVFDDGLFSKDAISWSSMIWGYGLHGKGDEAIVLYEKMLQLGIKPDAITMVGVLSACSRSGLVDEGLKIYRSAVENYELEPTQEIGSCVVDMLGRTGQIDHAYDFIKAMPIEPGPSVWGSLLRVSEYHGNSEMRDLAHRFLVQVEPDNPSNFIGLSNSYASSEKWDVAAEVRTLMQGRGLKKVPGSSRITVNY